MSVSSGARVFVVSACSALAACAQGQAQGDAAGVDAADRVPPGETGGDARFDAPSPGDATSEAALDVAVPDAAPSDAPSAEASEPEVGAPDVAPPDVPVVTGVDDAAVTATLFPRALGCTARTIATVTVLNTGTSTWTSAAGYGLGAVDGSDPLSPTVTRVRLPDGESVAPGASREFEVPLAAPGRAGTFLTDWRMVRDGAEPFGAVASQDVRVSCDTPSAADFRLDAVEVVSSPDVRSFAVTSRITSVSFAPGRFHIDHERRGTWPPVVIADDGTTQEATVWVFFHIAGRWYATGGERLRPNQADKELPNPSFIGREWLYDPGRWRDMTGYVPSPGDLVGFMVVAGSTRSDDRTPARERTGVVLLPFPRDGVESAYPPFAWQE